MDSGMNRREEGRKGKREGLAYPDAPHAVFQLPGSLQGVLLLQAPHDVGEGARKSQAASWAGKGGGEGRRRGWESVKRSFLIRPCTF